MRLSLPEQVTIELPTASFGSRAVAYLLDALVRWMVVAVIGIGILTVLTFVVSVDHIRDVVEAGRLLVDANDLFILLMSLGVILLFLIEWSYPMYFELRHGGVTPGKHAMGLRVVTEQGLPLQFRESFLRAALLPIDLFPGVGLVGLLSMVLNGRHQRVGDAVAGTVVIREQEKKVDAASSAKGAEYALPLELYTLLQQYVARMSNFDRSVQAKVTERLFTALSNVVPEAVAAEPVLLAERNKLLVSVLKNSRPLRVQAETNQVKRAGEVDWQLIRDDIRESDRQLQVLTSARGQRLSRGALFSLAQAYQRLCQRYGYLASFFPGTAESHHAASLVARGRRLVYGRRLDRRETDHCSFKERLGVTLREIAPYTVLATAAACVGALVCSALVMLNPDIKWLVFSEETAAKLRAGELWTEQIQGMSALASSKILTNNIGVCLYCFGAGVSAGVGTLLILLINGGLLGGIFTALDSFGMAGRLLDFVVAHGVLELSIIFVSGGCGLYLGDALIRPGHESRITVLRRRARRAVDVMMINALWLVLAGIIEGYISPYPLPFAVKLLVGCIAGGLYWYLFVVLTQRAAIAAPSP